MYSIISTLRQICVKMAIAKKTPRNNFELYCSKVAPSNEAEIGRSKHAILNQQFIMSPWIIKKNSTCVIQYML